MANLVGFDRVDMSDFRSSVSEVTYADNDLIILEDYPIETYYFGRFSYPDDQWKGVITKAQTYYDNELVVSVSGLALSTKFATVGATVQQAYRAAFADGDRFRGSNQDDYLAAYAGNDVVRGGAGADRLLGMTGKDTLYGGAGSDRLWGGAQNDMLDGGWGVDALRGDAGNDLLTGGRGRDTFIFNDNDGRDRIEDFENGLDRITILDGADEFSDLRIYRVEGGVRMFFADTVVTVEGVAKTQIDEGDFLFG